MKPWALQSAGSLEIGDFNLDARQEVCLESDQLIVWVRPALGGHIYELDLRENATNLLATLDRRPEIYHAAIVKAAADRGNGNAGGGATTEGGVTLKQEGLEAPWSMTIILARHSWIISIGRMSRWTT